MLPSPFLLPSLCHRPLLFIWNIALLCLLHIHTLTAIKLVSLKQGSHTQIPRSQQYYANEWSKPAVCILNARLPTSTKKYTLPLLGTYDPLSLSLSFTLPILIGINWYRKPFLYHYSKNNNIRTVINGNWHQVSLSKRKKTGSSGDKLHSAGPFKGDNAQL